MPLVAALYQEGDEQQHDPADTAVERKKQAYFAYETDAEEQHLDDATEILTRPRPTKSVPELPPKSRLRTSRILDNVSIDLQDVGRRKLEDDASLYSNPHESYLSSEEDGSASGDDYESVASDSDQKGKQSTNSSRRSSHEETARAVSLRCVKPQLVDITHHQQSVSNSLLHSINERRRSSVSSSKSPSVLTVTATHPKRHSSLARPTLSLDIYATPKPSETPPEQTHPSFLSKDPFPESAASITSPNPMLARSSTSSSLTPKSVRHHSHWSSLRAMSRTLTLARKKTSMPKINLAYTADVVPKHATPSPSIAISPAMTSSSPSSSTLSFDCAGANTSTSSYRRRSQALEKLMAYTMSRESRSQSEDWSNDTSPILLIQSNTELPRQSIPAPPVEETIAPVPSIARHPSTATRLEAHQQRSSTTSQAFSSLDVKSRSWARSSVEQTNREDSTSITSTQSTPTTFTISSSSTSELPFSPKELRSSKRMTTFSDYSRSSRTAREQSRGSDHTDHPPVLRPESETVISKTHQDIIKSVTTLIPVEGGVVERRDRDHSSSNHRDSRRLRPTGSMALLSGMGVGLRRSKGVRA